MSIRQKPAANSSKKRPRKPPPAPSADAARDRIQQLARTVNAPDLLRDVAAWWAHALGIIDSIQSTAEEIAVEAQRPDSPLYSATSAEHWHRFAGALQDCGMVNCSITFGPGLPDPLRSLTDLPEPLGSMGRKGGAK